VLSKTRTEESGKTTTTNGRRTCVRRCTHDTIMLSRAPFCGPENPFILLEFRRRARPFPRFTALTFRFAVARVARISRDRYFSSRFFPPPGGLRVSLCNIRRARNIRIGRSVFYFVFRRKSARIFTACPSLSRTGKERRRALNDDDYNNNNKKLKAYLPRVVVIHV